jgi:hypothetical protein
MVLLIMGDLAFGIRKAISAWIATDLGQPSLSSLGSAGAFVSEHFATLAGVIVSNSASHGRASRPEASLRGEAFRSRVHEAVCV